MDSSSATPDPQRHDPQRHDPQRHDPQRPDPQEARPGNVHSEHATPGRTITKKELVARIAERTNQTKVVAKDIIQLFLDEIIRELGNGNRLEFREFGVFEIKERAARKAQNPRTLEKVDVPAKRVVKFKVGRLMKECVADKPAPGSTTPDHEAQSSSRTD